MGVLGYGSMDRRFFHRLGASRLDRTICATAGGDALISVYGKKLGTDPEHFRHAKYIIAWAANIHGNNVHLWPFVQEARRNGARLVVIDPYRTRTAQVADWHIPIQPGTDTALALGLMRVIIEEGLYDRDYVAQNTVGFEELRQHVQIYTPDHVAGLTGIPAADIERLAREYASSAASVYSFELRHTAIAERRSRGSRSVHAAGVDRRLETPGRRFAALAQRRLHIQWHGTGTARPDDGQPAEGPGARGQHVPAWTTRSPSWTLHR